MVWKKEQCVFPEKQEAIFRNRHSVMQNPHEFRLHFNVKLQSSLTSYNVVMKYINAFEITVSVNKQKSTGQKLYIQIPEIL